MRKLTKIAAAVSGALLLSYGAVAKADITPLAPSAYAESTLSVTNFQITQAGGGSLLGLLGTEIQGLQASVQSQVAANLNGTPDAAAAIINPLLAPPPIGGQTISIDAAVGAGYAGFPFVSYGVGTLAPTTFAGAASEHSGNALQQHGLPPTTALTQSQVNIIQSSSVGSADSRQNLATTFNLVLTAPLVFDVTFLASSFARIALGQADVIAQIDRNWGIDVRNVSDPLNSLLLMSWEPDGLGGGLTGACVVAAACSVLADSFNLNLQAALQNVGDFDQTNPVSPFGVRVALGPGSYQLAINHDVSADAQAAPEPGSLALLGAGLLGLAALRRKFKKA